MKIDKLTDKQGTALLLCFAGWSAVPELFAPLQAPEGCDVWVVYDYRDLNFEADLSPYTRVDVVAWSLGVWVAARTLAGQQVHSATAINGTPLPVNDTFGIPRAIFEGTLQQVTPEGMARFDRRMCGTRELLAHYHLHPSRPVEELEEELRHLYQHIEQEEWPEFRWTRALVATHDRIFPTENQLNYWHGRCPVAAIDNTPHYPFQQWTQWNQITG